MTLFLVIAGVSSSAHDIIYSGILGEIRLLHEETQPMSVQLLKICRYAMIFPRCSRVPAKVMTVAPIDMGFTGVWACFTYVRREKHSPRKTQ